MGRHLNYSSKCNNWPTLLDEARVHNDDLLLLLHRGLCDQTSRAFHSVLGILEVKSLREKTGRVYVWHRLGEAHKAAKGLYAGRSHALYSSTSHVHFWLLPFVTSQKFCAGSWHRLRPWSFLFAATLFYPGIKQCYSLSKWNRENDCSWLVPVHSHYFKAGRPRRLTAWSFYADLWGVQVTRAWTTVSGRGCPLQWREATRSLLKKVFYYFNDLLACDLRYHNRPLLLPPIVSVQRTVSALVGCCLHRLPVEVLRCLSEFRTVQLWYLLVELLLRSRWWKIQRLRWLLWCQAV